MFLYITRHFVENCQNCRKHKKRLCKRLNFVFLPELSSCILPATGQKCGSLFVWPVILGRRRVALRVWRIVFRPANFLNIGINSICIYYAVMQYLYRKNRFFWLCLVWLGWYFQFASFLHCFCINIWLCVILG